MTPCCKGLPTIQPVTVSPELAPDTLGWSCELPSETDQNAEHIPCPNQRRVAGSPADGEFRSAPKVLNRMNQAILFRFTLTYPPCQCQGERSNCRVCQEAFACAALGTSSGCQGVCGVTLAGSLVHRLRRQAVRATVAAFPPAHRRCATPRRTGVSRPATCALLSQAARPWARPPQPVRVPCRVPRARGTGAPPTRAARRWRLTRPHAGRSRRTGRGHTGPMPGPLGASRRSVWARGGEG
jgi:hypothetical protein